MTAWEEFLRITRSKEPEITVDFSSISIDDLVKLKELLFRFAVADIQRITFNLQLFDSPHEPAKAIPPDAFARFGSSVFVQLPSFPQEVGAVIARMLSRTKGLRRVAIESIELPLTEIGLICQAIASARCLREVSFENVPLFDEGFELLASALFHGNAHRLEVTRCRLTDAIAGSVIRLIRKHTAIQTHAWEMQRRGRKARKLVSLVHYDFRGNRLSQNFLQAITDSVRDSPIQMFDLRDNPRIPAARRRSNVFLLGSSCLNRRHKRSPMRPLLLEHGKLRSRLTTLIGDKPIAAVDRDTFIVGKRAKELARRITELDLLYRRLEVQSRRTDRENSE
jgi:hypothetical protein